MQSLLSSILSKALNTEVESINQPGIPFRMFVSFKNVDTLYGRIIPAKAVEKINLEKYKSDYWKRLSNLAYADAFMQQLPATKDFQKHSVEIKNKFIAARQVCNTGFLRKKF